MDRTYMYFRISTSESVIVYYMLSLIGTEPPLAEELLNKEERITLKRQTDVIELFGNNASF